MSTLTVMLPNGILDYFEITQSLREEYKVTLLWGGKL